MIRITRQTDYGIVLLSILARGGSPIDRDGGPVGTRGGNGDDDCAVYTAPGLAEAANLPLPMVQKTLKLLARSGLLESQRGVHGGYRLARESGEITVAQMIAALEGPIAITACSDTHAGGCAHEGGCCVEANWQIINRAVRDVLEGITLAEMAQGSLRRLAKTQ